MCQVYLCVEMFVCGVYVFGAWCVSVCVWYASCDVSVYVCVWYACCDVSVSVGVCVFSMRAVM